MVVKVVPNYISNQH